MRVTITTWQGTHEGVLLAEHNGRIRVAISGSDDAVEYYNCGGQWFSESWEPVHVKGHPPKTAWWPAFAWMEFAGGTASIN